VNDANTNGFHEILKKYQEFAQNAKAHTGTNQEKNNSGMELQITL
jgi:hypothetical protein